MNKKNRLYNIAEYLTQSDIILILFLYIYYNIK